MNTDLPILTRLRQQRARTGLSQAALAARVGLSRQAVVAIEAGRQVPSTLVALQLARALRCSVEDLFALPTAASLCATLSPKLPAPPGARLALGRVDGQWAAHPIATGDRPGDGLLVSQTEDGRAMVEPLFELRELERNVLVAGCAPLLGVLTGCLDRQRQDARATWIPAHSTDALELLAQGLVHVAGVHLADTEQPDGHATIVQARLPRQSATLINLTRWRQGLVVAAGNPLGIRDVSDLVRPDLRIARREPGAGAHALLQRLLTARNLAVEPLKGPIAPGHAEVARWVRLGVADAGIAIESAALSEGLDFIPLSEERFDLIVPRARLDARPVAQLLDMITRSPFRSDAGRIAGYDLSTAGHTSSIAATPC